MEVAIPAATFHLHGSVKRDETRFWIIPANLCKVYSLCVQVLQNNVMPLWMASRGYTTIQQNNYPTGVGGPAVLATIAYAVISDKLQSRWEVSIAIGLTFVIGLAILVSSPSTDAGYFVAFYLLGSGFACQAVWYSWMADVTAYDFQLRAITTGFDLLEDSPHRRDLVLERKITNQLSDNVSTTRGRYYFQEVYLIGDCQ